MSGLRCLEAALLQRFAYGPTVDVETWLDELPAALLEHGRVLRRLIAAVRAEPGWRWLELCCSLARGTADAYSDLDLGLGVAEDAWPTAAGRVIDVASTLAPVVGLLSHELAGWTVRHRRIFVQYSSGVQIDLVVLPADLRSGLPSGSLALYDADGRLAAPLVPSGLNASIEDVEWAFLGWIALGNVAKYLRRGSLWEAMAQLDQARIHVWRLLAVARRVDHPAFGLTSLLDQPNAKLPEAARRTLPAGLERAALREAALAAAGMLAEAAAAAQKVTGAASANAMAAFTLGRLTRLDN